MERDAHLSGLWLTLAALRFAAEIAMLVALAYVGWRAAQGNLPVGLALAVVLPAIAAATWGLWVAPRASRRLRDPARLVIEVTLFAATALGLLAFGAQPWSAVAAVALWAAWLASLPVGRKGH